MSLCSEEKMSKEIRTYLKGWLFIELKRFRHKNVMFENCKKLRTRKYGCHYGMCKKTARYYLKLSENLRNGYIQFETYLCIWHLKKLYSVKKLRHE
jgi:translation initiation factor RLI1